MLGALLGGFFVVNCLLSLFLFPAQETVLSGPFSFQSEKKTFFFLEARDSKQCELGAVFPL